jgi:c-di-GMP-related signal transduction protein
MRISYSQEETIKIVKKNFKKVDDDQIKLYIDEYGCKPRFIFERLEKEGKKKE